MNKPKYIVAWIIVATFTLVVGWFLAVHGGESYKTAWLLGQPSNLYFAETVIAKVLMWAPVGAVWLEGLFGLEEEIVTSSDAIFIAIHFAGYGLVFFGVWKLRNNARSNRKGRNKSAT